MGRSGHYLASSLDCVQSGPACCACRELIEMSRAAYDRPEVSAWDVARNLGLSGVVTGLSSGVNKCRCRVVAGGGLAQGAAGGVGGARVQRSGLAGSTRYGFTEPGAPQPQADRISVLLGLQHGSVNGG